MGNIKFGFFHDLLQFFNTLTKCELPDLCSHKWFENSAEKSLDVTYNVLRLNIHNLMYP